MTFIVGASQVSQCRMTGQIVLHLATNVSSYTLLKHCSGYSVGHYIGCWTLHSNPLLYDFPISEPHMYSSGGSNN